jgi:hypothetical protein
MAFATGLRVVHGAKTVLDRLHLLEFRQIRCERVLVGKPVGQGIKPSRRVIGESRHPGKEDNGGQRPQDSYSGQRFHRQVPIGNLTPFERRVRRHAKANAKIMRASLPEILA